MKKGFTLIELIAVIVILAIVMAVSYPKMLSVIEKSKISAFDTAKKNIISAAKNKYIASVNDSKVIEYSVVDLIEDGYVSSNTKNPITGKDYEKEVKVVVVNEDNTVKFYYVNGNTMYDVIKREDKAANENDDYIFKGNSENNYISFNEDIYRIIKVDSYGYTYIIKDISDNNIQKKDINTYLGYNINDEIKESYIKYIENNEGILTKSLYEITTENSNSYLLKNKNTWLKDNDDYKILSVDTGEILDASDNDYASVKNVLKLKNIFVVEKGDGSRFNPYAIKILNY